MYDGRIGVHIDIFPQDYLPDDKLERTKFLKEIFKMSEALASTGFPAYISGTKWYYQFARVFYDYHFLLNITVRIEKSLKN
ncbi:hypothetical protein ACGO3R_07185 [Lactococcus lactis]